MKSTADDRNIDDDPTLKIGALRTTSSSAVGSRPEFYDPARAELSSDVLYALRLMTPPAPRKPHDEKSLPRAVPSLARVAAVHLRPTRKVDAMVVLATMLAIVTGTARRLAETGRRHGVSFAKALSLVATESVARVRRKVSGVAFSRPLQAGWRARARSRGIGQRDGATPSLLLRR